MAKLVELKERGTNDIMYPITRPECVIDDNGMNIALVISNMSIINLGGIDYCGNRDEGYKMKLFKKIPDIILKDRSYIAFFCTSTEVSILKILKISDYELAPAGYTNNIPTVVVPEVLILPTTESLSVLPNWWDPNVVKE